MFSKTLSFFLPFKGVYIIHKDRFDTDFKSSLSTFDTLYGCQISNFRPNTPCGVPLEKFAKKIEFFVNKCVNNRLWDRNYPMKIIWKFFSKLCAAESWKKCFGRFRFRFRFKFRLVDLKQFCNNLSKNHNISPHQII